MHWVACPLLHPICWGCTLSNPAPTPVFNSVATCWCSWVNVWGLATCVSFWGPILSLDIRSQAAIQPRASMKGLRRHRSGLLKQSSYASCLVSVRFCAFCTTLFRGHETLNPTWNTMGVQYWCYSPDAWNEIPLCEEDSCIWECLLMPAVSTAQSDNLALR